jgi:hypothetical protein
MDSKTRETLISVVLDRGMFGNRLDAAAFVARLDTALQSFNRVEANNAAALVSRLLGE